jgi:hypothetical protein
MVPPRPVAGGAGVRRLPDRAGRHRRRRPAAGRARAPARRLHRPRRGRPPARQTVKAADPTPSGRPSARWSRRSCSRTPRGRPTTSAREAFGNWLATRRATEQPDQDAELVARTRALDGLKPKEDEARQKPPRRSSQIVLDARPGRAAGARVAVGAGARRAGTLGKAEYRAQELRVFGYRLALTLPLLVAAGWLFARKRAGTWWPFVWGFILFALFAFFVELVPYLPSYGGYVRYIGRHRGHGAGGALRHRRAEPLPGAPAGAEALPDTQRRQELSATTLALARLAKGVCPGCERRWT